MTFLKNKTFWLMLFIVILGTVLRLIFINKPDGLWNDEYVSWSIAAIPFGKNFIEAISAQCHMPFYYLYLKFFIHFFGNNDLMLRLTSVLPGVLSIISMYFVGKEVKDNKLGVLTASITALSSFLIYFSQEVRFYEILFLFSSLSLLFTFKLCKKQSLSNLVLYIVSNFLIIFTHTLGIIFVFFNLLFLTHQLIKANEKYKKSMSIIWGSLLLLTIINIPLMYKIFTTHQLSQWWGHFTLSKIGFMITDYFSPVLTNIVNAPDNFFYNLNFEFIILALLPSAIAVTGITKSLMAKKNELTGIFCICLGFIFTLMIMVLSGKLLFITKYSIEIYPILIVLMAYGLMEFKKNWRYVLIFLFCFLNLFYILQNRNSAPKMHRSEGHKIVADLLNNADLNKKDFILINYYPQNRFEKYFDFSNYNVACATKGDYTKYLGVKNKEDFKNLDNNVFEVEFKNEVLSKLKPNQKVAVVILKNVALYSPTKMHALIKDKKEFEKTPFFFLVFSQIRNNILESCLKNLQILKIEEKGSWSVVTFINKG